MKLKLILLAIVIAGSALKIYAQDSRFAFSLGGSLNVVAGEDFSNATYQDGRMSYQFNGNIGFISVRGENSRGNMIGVFGTAGTLYPKMVARIAAGGVELEGPLNMNKNINEFYNVEFGFIISRMFRLSGGMGRQMYTYYVNQKGAIDYYSGTVGLNFNLGIVDWVVECNVAAGEDLTNEIIKLSTGFMVKF
jgi:hypothetical protein